MSEHSIRSLSTSPLFAGPKGSWSGLSPMAAASFSFSAQCKNVGAEMLFLKKANKDELLFSLVQILFPALLKVVLPTSDTAASSLQGPPCSISRHPSHPKAPKRMATLPRGYDTCHWHTTSSLPLPSLLPAVHLPSVACHSSIAAPTEQWVSPATSSLQGAGGHRGRTKMQHKAAFSPLNDHWLTTE